MISPSNRFLHALILSMPLSLIGCGGGEDESTETKENRALVEKYVDSSPKKSPNLMGGREIKGFYVGMSTKDFLEKSKSNFTKLGLDGDFKPIIEENEKTVRFKITSVTEHPATKRMCPISINSENIRNCDQQIKRKEDSKNLRSTYKGNLNRWKHEDKAMYREKLFAENDPVKVCAQIAAKGFSEMNRMYEERMHNDYCVPNKTEELEKMVREYEFDEYSDSGRLPKYLVEERNKMQEESRLASKDLDECQRLVKQDEIKAKEIAEQEQEVCLSTKKRYEHELVFDGISKDGGKTIDEISMTKSAGRKLFNTELPLIDDNFVQSFINGYDIPKMEPYNRDILNRYGTVIGKKHTGWTFKDVEGGYQITLGDGTGLRLERISSTSGTVFD